MRRSADKSWTKTACIMNIMKILPPFLCAQSKLCPALRRFKRRLLVLHLSSQISAAIVGAELHSPARQYKSCPAFQSLLFATRSTWRPNGMLAFGILEEKLTLTNQILAGHV